MKKTTVLILSLVLTQATFAMPCDFAWSCKSTSGKYYVSMHKCNDANSAKHLNSLKMNGKLIEGAEVTAAYDSVSVGGHVLAFEIQIPDEKNDARFLSFESNGKTGQVTERIQPYNPGQQRVVGSEKITCESTDKTD